MQHIPSYECDIAIIGGGMGGVAAALAAAEAGMRVVLTEATDWIGGQMTSQGVSALDEHPHIERFGGTRAYIQLRKGIRAYYRERYNAPATMPDSAPLNPGNGWVSRLCFEPRVALGVLQSMLAPHIAAQRIILFLQHTPVAAEVDGDRVVSVTLAGTNDERRLTTDHRPLTLDDRPPATDNGQRTTDNGQRATVVCARYFLDATDLGDLLPLTCTEYVSGAEGRAETGEPHANPAGPQPDETQGFTYCFAVEYCPGEDHTISKPTGYERFRDEQPYTFVLRGHHGEARPFKMFSMSPEGLLPFWTYRRILDGALLDPIGATHDVVLINWAGNDYHWANLIDKPAEEQARIHDEARRLALGFLYWLQTEAPHDQGLGSGYPGLKLRPDIMGTDDGLSKAPYIRESRRILALRRIVEGDIAAEGREGKQAAHFDDAVGIGWYHIDLHSCVGNPHTMFAPTLPFQIPLGALIPRRVINLLAACKNIGTTHITNGAYRLHPIEWNIGEAAGALAAYCCAISSTPRQVWENKALLRAFQDQLVQRGVPLAWEPPTTDD
jgi:hypothetical protein